MIIRKQNEERSIFCCGNILLKCLPGLLAQPLKVCGVTSGTHSARVVGGEFFFFDFNLGMVPWY
jgi:hypothetical protein